MTKEAVIPVDGGVDIDLEYESTSEMMVYWKKVVSGTKGNYWIPIHGMSFVMLGYCNILELHGSVHISSIPHIHEKSWWGKHHYINILRK